MPGDLSETPPVDLCLRLAGERATGTLALSGPEGEAVLVFADGRLTGGRPPGRGAPLGERLVAAGRLARPDLDAALADHGAEPGATALGRLLVERGLASEDEVRLFVQEQALETLLAVASWLDGAWDFRPATDVAPSGAGPGMPVERAVEEVRRRAGERARIAAVVPSPTAVFAVVPDGGEGDLDPAAADVLDVVDGQRSVRDVADALGTGVDEASRQLFRLVLQGRAVLADTMVTTPARATSATPDPATEDAALHASPTTGPPPVQLADDGWATARAQARTVADEPEPWVGWANGGGNAAAEAEEREPERAATPTTTGPLAGLDDDPVDQLHAATSDPATSLRRPVDPTPAPEPAPSEPVARPGVDADTRRQLFSELHEVGRAHPGIGAAPAPVREEPTGPEPDAVDEPVAADAPAPEPDAAPPLSRSDVSDLLRELHALNLDD